MAIISENFHVKKAKKYGINIKTIYKNGHEYCERNLDNTKNDDVYKGIRLKKEYYKNNKLLYTTSKFDSRIEYTYINNKNEESNMECPNCGFKAKVRNFIDGCPYCGTIYNIEYNDKDLGSKQTYDNILKRNIYRVIVFFLTFIISFCLCYVYFKYTGRTFNEYDILKVIAYTLILTAVLYYIFYLLDGYIVLLPIKIYKNMINQKQIKFWNRMYKLKVDKKVFYNNINYEISKYYYDLSSNIIDYDILDYLEFEEFNKNGRLGIEVKLDIRIMRYIEDKIEEENINETFSFVREEKEIYNINEGGNYIKCPGCGSSLDVTKNKCDYCGYELKSLHEWVMIGKD